jgi:hypothetical protein
MPPQPTPVSRPIDEGMLQPYGPNGRLLTEEEIAEQRRRRGHPPMTPEEVAGLGRRRLGLPPTPAGRRAPAPGF